MCRKPIGHGLFLRCLLGDAGGDACVGIGLDFLLRMTGFVIPGGMQWSVGIFPLFSQCDPAGRRPAMCGRKRMIIIAHSAQLSPHCTGGGIRSDGGSSARSGRENDGQQASAEAACGLCRAATVEAVQSFASQQRSLLCPLSEHLRPIPTEVPCGHFWRHLLVTKGGKSAPCRRHPIGGAGCARNENRLFLQCDPAGRRPAKIQFRKIRSSAAAEERKPAAAHAEGGIAPPAASGTSSAGRGLTKGARTLAAPRIFRLGKKQINLHCFRLFVSLACRRYFRSAMFE